MKNKDQILLENIYSDIVNDKTKSKYQKLIESLPEKPETKIDKTSEMKGNPIPIKNLEVGKIYDLLVKSLNTVMGDEYIFIRKETGYMCEPVKSDPYKYGAIFKLKNPNMGMGNIDYALNEVGDTQFGNRMEVSVYESDVTPDEFSAKTKKSIEAFYDNEKEHKRKYGPDSSPYE